MENHLSPILKRKKGTNFKCEVLQILTAVTEAIIMSQGGTAHHPPDGDADSRGTVNC